MTITEIIEQLTTILNEHGDLECGSTDGSPDEGYTYEFDLLNVVAQLPSEEAADQTPRLFVNIRGGENPLDLDEYLDEADIGELL